MTPLGFSIDSERDPISCLRFGKVVDKNLWTFDQAPASCVSSTRRTHPLFLILILMPPVKLFCRFFPHLSLSISLYSRTVMRLRFPVEFATGSVAEWTDPTRVRIGDVIYLRCKNECLPIIGGSSAVKNLARLPATIARMIVQKLTICYIPISSLL